MQALHIDRRVLEFPKRMATPNTTPNPRETSGWNPQAHGNVAQWAAVIMSGCALLASVFLPLWFHHTASQAQATDDHVNLLIEAKLTPVNKGISDLAEKIGKLQGRFEQLDSEQKKATKLQLNKLSAQIAILQKSKTKLDQRAVAQLGDSILAFVSSSDPQISKLSRQTAVKLADYRTILNEDAVSHTIKAAKSVSHEGYPYFDVEARAVGGGIGKLVVCIDKTKTVPFSEAARYERIGSPNPTGLPGYEYVVVSGIGTEIRLDGHRLKNVIIHDVDVVYEGGPLIMENVSFVNCMFRFPSNLTPNADQLTAAILSSPAVSFSTEKAGD
jgi:hypothetical protein